jgi:hypothetical protein
MLPTVPITIRRAHPEETGVLRVAALDSSRVPRAPLLVAEVNGQVRAALSIETGKSIADPFHATRDLLQLLEAHAANTRRRTRPGLLARVGLRPRTAH